MTKFLYISRFFPPMGGAEPRYNVSLIRHLCKAGFRPTVLTSEIRAHDSLDPFLASLVPAEAEVHRIPWAREGKLTPIGRRARRVLRTPANPLGFTGWRRVYDSARVLAQRFDFRFIHSVHGLGAAHLAALRLKRETGLPWIAEFQDPWSYNWIVWNGMEARSSRCWCSLNRARTQRALRRVATTADVLVTESPAHAARLREEFGRAARDVIPAAMGWDADLAEEGGETPIVAARRPAIGHVGTLYGGYDYVANRFVRALKQLEAEGQPFTFLSLGDRSGAFRRAAAAHALSCFASVESLPLDQALALMKGLDFGLVCVAQEYPLHLTSKVWEYLQSGLSVLGIVPAEGSVAEVITGGNCGYLLPYDADQMVPVLRQALDEWESGTSLHASPEYVAGFERARTIQPLVERLRQLSVPASRAEQ